MREGGRGKGKREREGKKGEERGRKGTRGVREKGGKQTTGRKQYNTEKIDLIVNVEQNLQLTIFDPTILPIYQFSCHDICISNRTATHFNKIYIPNCLLFIVEISVNVEDARPRPVVGSRQVEGSRAVGRGSCHQPAPNTQMTKPSSLGFEHCYLHFLLIFILSHGPFGVNTKA